jgi:hypothetical protein
MKEKKRGKYTHTSYQQYYNGIPVENAYINITYTQNDEIIYVQNDYIYDIDLITSPNISSDQAIQNAENDWMIDPVSISSNHSKLVIYFSENTRQNYLAYKVRLFSLQPLSSYIYYVNAANGEIIEKFNVLQDAAGIVRGYILPENGSNPIFSLEPLQNIYINVGGDQVVTTNDGTFTSVNSSGNVVSGFAGLNFNVRRDPNQIIDTNFMPSNYSSFTLEWNTGQSTNYANMDELNVYYHLEKFRDYFVQSLDDYPIAYNLRAYTHLDITNAYYDNNTGYLYFGRGSAPPTVGYFAHYAEIIYHEFVHGAISSIYARDVLNFDEMGAMSEAYADYFACSFLNDPVILDDDFNIFTERDLDESVYGHKSFPADFNFAPYEEHANSLIFSQVLWKLRVSLGQVLADQLIYDSLYFEPRTFILGFEAILIVDDDDGDLSNGTPNKGAIQAAFSAHNIPTSGETYMNDTYEVNNSISNAYQVNINEVYTSYISRKGDYDYYQFQLLHRDKADEVSIKLQLPNYNISDFYFSYDVIVFDENKQQVASNVTHSAYLHDFDSNNLTLREKERVATFLPGEGTTFYALIRGSAGFYGSPAEFYNTYYSFQSYEFEISTAQLDQERVKVFPNPYKPNSSDGSRGSSGVGYNSGIIFQGLPEEAKLEIFDLKGRKVFETSDIIGNWYQWDVKDHNEDDVPSGLYIFIITNPELKPKKGKFAIIR